MKKEIKCNYRKLGLKCGIEIHQQLNSHKLFCECPSILRNDAPDAIIKRRIYAVAGEEGKIDIAAAYEQEKSKLFVYEGYSDSTCQVEFDSEPPHNINEEALRIAIQVSLLLNAKIIPVSQIMRKTVVDGSNTSGFQRTMLLAKDGYVETKHGKIGIATIGLEEDSARIIKQEKNSATYRLDRLGIPLVEIATQPDIPNAEAAKETALKIGEILRACNVKRGIGTIRQDVNLSIAKGARTEVKGVQEPNLISKTIDEEIERQLALIREKKRVEPTVRKALENGKNEFLRPLPGAARMYPETDLPLVIISREMIDDTKRNLPKLKEEIFSELKKEGINEEYINMIVNEKKIELLKRLEKTNVNINTIAKIIALYPKEIAGKEKIDLEKVENALNENIMLKILENAKKGNIDEGSIRDAMTRIVKGEKFEDILKGLKGKMEIDEKEIKKICGEKKGLSINAIMGVVMSRFKGKIDPRKASELIKKYCK